MRGTNGEGYLKDERSGRDSPDSRGKQNNVQKATHTIVWHRRKMRLRQAKLHLFCTKGWEGAVPLIAPASLCHSPGVIFKLHFSFPHQSGRHVHHLKNYLMNAAFEMKRTGLDTGCMKCAGEPQELQTTPLKVITLLLSNPLIWIVHRRPIKVKFVRVMRNIVW